MCFIIFIIFVHAVYCSRMFNQNYSIYKVTAFNANERAMLYSLHTKEDDIIFLNGVTNDAAIPMDIILEERKSDKFEKMLNKDGIEFYFIDGYLMSNELIDIQKRYHTTAIVNITEHFMSYKTIEQWVKAICRKHVHLKQITIELTYEKREILLLKYSTGHKKPAVFILAGEEGRDWMSPAVVMNFIQLLLDNKNKLSILIELYDLYFLPLFNPDGYAYSMEWDRLWNKNRKVFYPQKRCINNKTAIGVNVDRNWYFAETSATDECLSVYLGHRSLSEEETGAVSSFLNTIAFDLIAFIDVRGFENLITVPYADPNEHTNNYAITREILVYAITKANEKFDTRLRFDTTASCFYNHSGNVADWVKKKFNTPIVYTHYLENDFRIFPDVKDVEPLTEHFALILKETMLLANSIYQPLFNKQIKLQCNYFLLFAYIVCKL